MVPGEVLRQQHKEHDANRQHILSHIGDSDLLQESQTNNDRCKPTLWRSASSVAMYLMVPLPSHDDSPLRRHAKVTDAGSTIRINQHVLGLDVRVEDALGVQILDAVNRIREHTAHIRLCHRLLSAMMSSLSQAHFSLLPTLAPRISHWYMHTVTQSSATRQTTQE
jgi:hypothetical protein